MYGVEKRGGACKLGGQETASRCRKIMSCMVSSLALQHFVKNNM